MVSWEQAKRNQPHQQPMVNSTVKKQVDLNQLKQDKDHSLKQWRLWRAKWEKLTKDFQNAVKG